jgi:CDP-glycerol glycerophosphotransferase (TagB/SpsB family)
LRVQVLHDIEQYDCVLTPIEEELVNRGVVVTSGRDADASVICQTPIVPPKVAHPCFLVFHGVSVFKSWVKDYDVFPYVDYVVLPGKIWESITKNSRHTKTLPLGWSKADLLLKGDKKLSKQSILSKFNIKNGKPVVLFAPTYNNGNLMNGQANRLNDVLNRLHNYNVIFAPHQRDVDVDTGYPMTVSPCEDRIPYLLGSDLVISDVSSVSIEASLIDKPIVLLDNPKHKNYFVVKSGKSQRVLNVGKRATIDTLGEAVTTALAHPKRCEIQRKRWAEDVVGYGLDGKSTKRIVDAVLKG